MLTVAKIDAGYKDNAQKAVAAGASVLLLTGNPGESDIKTTVDAAGETPCGVAMSDTSGIDELAGFGVDFVTLDSSAPASTLQTEGIDFVLLIDEDMPEIGLRTIEPLSVQALYTQSPPSILTIGRQMEIQRITGLARKPLLMAPAGNVTKDDLLALRDSGAALLAVDVAGSDDTEELERLNDLISSLPPRSQRRTGEKAGVTLPMTSRAVTQEEDDEDEDD